MNNELNNLRKNLDEFLAKKKLKEINKDRNAVVNDISKEVVRVFAPALQQMADNARVSKEEIRNIAEEIAAKINIPEINIPEIVMPSFPSVNVPEPRVTVNFDASKIKVSVPEIRVPDVIMPTSMRTTIDGVDKMNPMPVMMMDGKGLPLGFPGGGGKSDFFTIKDIRASSISVIDQDVGAIRVVGNLQASLSGSTQVTLTNFDGLAYNSDNPLPITGSLSTTPGATFFASDAIGSTNVIQLAGNPIAVGSGVDGVGVQRVVLVSDVSNSVFVTGATGTIGTVIINPDGNPTYASATSGLTDTELRATAVPVAQVSGANWSTSVTNTVTVSGTVAVSGVTGSIGATILNGEGLARDTWSISSVVSSIQAALVDSTGVQYSGSNPVPVVFGASATQAVNMVDSSGIAYSGSNPVPINLATALDQTIDSISVNQVSGANFSVSVTGGALSTTVSVLTRQTNPTAIAADYVPVAADDLGRQLVRPLQVRDLITTAYVAVSTGTEATLLAGSTGVFHDLIKIIMSNASTVAVGVDLRCVTAGNIVQHYEVPANGTTGESLTIPWPQDATGNNWTVDLPDITGTTVHVSALFSKEI